MKTRQEMMMDIKNDNMKGCRIEAMKKAELKNQIEESISTVCIGDYLKKVVDDHVDKMVEEIDWFNSWEPEDVTEDWPDVIYDMVIEDESDQTIADLVEIDEIPLDTILEDLYAYIEYSVENSWDDIKELMDDCQDYYEMPAYTWVRSYNW